MKEIRTYKCEKCGAIFDDPARAEECEGSHVDPYRITEALWDLSVDSYGKKMAGYDVYPKWVRIMMADGNIVIYGTDGGNTMQHAFYKGKMEKNINGEYKQKTGKGLPNLDIRIEVAACGLKYRDIAEEMGISPVWLSRMMRRPLSTKEKSRVLVAIETLKGKTEE